MPDTNPTPMLQTAAAIGLSSPSKVQREQPARPALMANRVHKALRDFQVLKVSKASRARKEFPAIRGFQVSPDKTVHPARRGIPDLQARMATMAPQGLKGHKALLAPWG